MKEWSTNVLQMYLKVCSTESKFMCTCTLKFFKFKFFGVGGHGHFSFLLKHVTVVVQKFFQRIYCTCTMCMSSSLTYKCSCRLPRQLSNVCTSSWTVDDHECVCVCLSVRVSERFTNMYALMLSHQCLLPWKQLTWTVAHLPFWDMCLCVFCVSNLLVSLPA